MAGRIGWKGEPVRVERALLLISPGQAESRRYALAIGDCDGRKKIRAKRRISGSNVDPGFA